MVVVIPLELENFFPLLGRFSEVSKALAFASSTMKPVASLCQ